MAGAPSIWHYRECGCTGQPLPLPTTVDFGVWEAPPSTAVRAGDVHVTSGNMGEVDAAARAELASLKAHAGFRPLRVMYLIPHHNLTGGMKMIMEHLRELMERGHHVTAVYRGTAGTPVLPPWATSARVSAELLIDVTESYDTLLRRMRQSVDVCLVGYFTQLGELMNIWAPLLYWEQGHEHIFAQGREPTTASLDVLFHATMSRVPCALAGVSTYVRDTLALQFNRRVRIIPNAIDANRFRPAAPLQDPLPGSVPTSSLLHDAPPPGVSPALSQGTPARVLLVGNPTQAFKGWDVALQALNSVHASAPGLRVTWVCQSQPQVQGVHFPIQFIVNPPQHTIPGLYAAGHEVFFFASRFEAWGMPVLEAMACGVPLVTTRCFGVDDFCVHMHNCLMAPTLDWTQLSRHVLQLLANRALAARLAYNARRTAERLTWARAGDQLEVALYRTAAYFRTQPHPPTPSPARAEWAPPARQASGGGNGDAGRPDGDHDMSPGAHGGTRSAHRADEHYHHHHRRRHDDIGEGGAEEGGGAVLRHQHRRQQQGAASRELVSDQTR